MDVFKMEKEFNELIKHGLELIEKLKEGKELIKEADENDVGMLCKFWDDNPEDYGVGILSEVDEDDNRCYCMESSYGDWYKHCRRLTPDEVSEFTGYRVEE